MDADVRRDLKIILEVVWLELESRGIVMERYYRR